MTDSLLSRRTPVFIAVLAALVLAVSVAYAFGSASPERALAAPAGAATTTEPATAATGDAGVAVSGLGRVTGTPDVLRLSMGVEVVRADVGAALSAANASLEKVRASLRSHKVANADMQTSDVSIYPDYTEKGQVRGYRVSESLTVRLRNLGDAGSAISDAVRAGGDASRLQGVSFSLEDNAKLLQQARAAAYNDAKAKAEQYAALTGRSLGPVKSVNESVVNNAPQPMMYRASAPASDSGGSPVPIEAGTSDVTVSVDVVWSLK